MLSSTLPKGLTRRRLLGTALGYAACSALTLPSVVRADALNTLKPLALPSPNAVLEAHDGTQRQLSDYAPTPLLVNFWASWCPPCVHELPSLVQLDAALRSRGMAVLLVGVDRKGRAFGEAFLKDRGIEMPYSTYDPKSTLARALNIRVMPSSFLIGADGEIRGKVEGPLDWGTPEVISAVAAALA